MKIKRDETVQARIDAELKLKLQKYTIKKHTSESDVIRMLLKKFLSKRST